MYNIIVIFTTNVNVQTYNTQYPALTLMGESWGVYFEIKQTIELRWMMTLSNISWDHQTPNVKLIFSTRILYGWGSRLHNWLHLQCVVPSVTYLPPAWDRLFVNLTWRKRPYWLSLIPLFMHRCAYVFAYVLLFRNIIISCICVLYFHISNSVLFFILLFHRHSLDAFYQMWYHDRVCLIQLCKYDITLT